MDIYEQNKTKNRNCEPCFFILPLLKKKSRLLTKKSKFDPLLGAVRHVVSSSEYPIQLVITIDVFGVFP